MHTIKIPASKSHTIRALYFCLFSSQISIIRNYLVCRDTDTMIEAMRSFGVRIDEDGDLLTVYPCPSFTIPLKPIDVGNSGLVFRLMTTFCSLFDHQITIVGDDSIRLRRIIKPLVQALRQGGAKVQLLDPPNNTPLRITGPIKPAAYTLNGSDSQPVSALLMTLGFLGGASSIHVQSPGECGWIDVTLAWLKHVGLKVKANEYTDYIVYSSGRLGSINITLSSDFSSATYPLTYSLLSKTPLRVLGLDLTDSHPDKGYFKILEKMGVDVSLDMGSIRLVDDLTGGCYNINDCVDTLPLLCLVGCYCKTPLRLTGAQICRKKESNRIEAMCCELKKMGARIHEFVDGCLIYPSRLKPSDTSSYEDHRIAMTLYLANKLQGFCSKIDNLECIAKSYPNFIQDVSPL